MNVSASISLVSHLTTQNDAWLHMGPKRMKLDGEILVPIVQVLGICLEKCTNVVVMNTTMKG